MLNFPVYNSQESDLISHSKLKRKTTQLRMQILLHLNKTNTGHCDPEKKQFICY